MSRDRLDGICTIRLLPGGQEMHPPRYDCYCHRNGSCPTIYQHTQTTLHSINAAISPTRLAPLLSLRPTPPAQSAKSCRCRLRTTHLWFILAFLKLVRSHNSRPTSGPHQCPTKSGWQPCVDYCAAAASCWPCWQHNSKYMPQTSKTSRPRTCLVPPATTGTCLPQPPPQHQVSRPRLSPQQQPQQPQ